MIAAQQFYLNSPFIEPYLIRNHKATLLMHILDI